MDNRLVPVVDYCLVSADDYLEIDLYFCASDLNICNDWCFS